MSTKYTPAQEESYQANQAINAKLRCIGESNDARGEKLLGYPCRVIAHESIIEGVSAKDFAFVSGATTVFADGVKCSPSDADYETARPKGTVFEC